MNHRSRPNQVFLTAYGSSRDSRFNYHRSQVSFRNHFVAFPNVSWRLSVSPIRWKSSSSLRRLQLIENPRMITTAGKSPNIGLYIERGVGAAGLLYRLIRTMRYLWGSCGCAFGRPSDYLREPGFGNFSIIIYFLRYTSIIIENYG